MTWAWPLVSVTCHNASLCSLPNDSLLHTLVTAQRPHCHEHASPNTGITLTQTQNKQQKLKPGDLSSQRETPPAVCLHLSKQWSFTGYLFSPRAPLMFHPLILNSSLSRDRSENSQVIFSRSATQLSPPISILRQQQVRSASANQRPVLPALTNQRPGIAVCWHGPHLFLFISISSPSSITEECCSVLFRFIAAHYYIQMIPSLTLWMLDNNTVIIS